MTKCRFDSSRASRRTSHVTLNTGVHRFTKGGSLFSQVGFATNENAATTRLRTQAFDALVTVLCALLEHRIPHPPTPSVSKRITLLPRNGGSLHIPDVTTNSGTTSNGQNASTFQMERVRRCSSTRGHVHPWEETRDKKMHTLSTHKTAPLKTSRTVRHVRDDVRLRLETLQFLTFGRFRVRRLLSGLRVPSPARLRLW